HRRVRRCVRGRRRHRPAARTAPRRRPLRDQPAPVQPHPRAAHAHDRRRRRLRARRRGGAVLRLRPAHRDSAHALRPAGTGPGDHRGRRRHQPTGAAAGRERGQADPPGRRVDGRGPGAGVGPRALGGGAGRAARHGPRARAEDGAQFRTGPADDQARGGRRRGRPPPDRPRHPGAAVRGRGEVPAHDRVPRAQKGEEATMTTMLDSYVCGSWRTPDDEGTVLRDAVTGEPVAAVSARPLDYGPVVDYARTVGGPALRASTFRERAAMLKALGKHLSARIPEFTELSLRTGATRRDAVVDIDGGINALFVYGSKGAKKLPDANVLADGGFEPLGKGGTFGVQHILTPRPGVAVQINAFNFPVWGMLEKLAPAVLAGVPSIVKPAGQTAYLTEAVFREIVASGILPDGAVQLVCARPDGLLDQ